MNQARLEETGLNIPKILEVTVINGKWAIVYEHIKGKSLSQLMAEQPEKFDEYLNMFADLQLDVLSRNCPELVPLNDKITRSICDTDFPATVRYDLLNRLGEMPRHSKICHGDFNPQTSSFPPTARPTFSTGPMPQRATVRPTWWAAISIFLYNNDEATAAIRN